MAIRKIFLLPLICLSSVFYCTAGNGGSLTVGANAGPGLSSLYGPSSYSNDIYGFHSIQPSVSAGINFRYNFPKIVSIGSGIYYCQFGLSGYQNPNLYPDLNFLNRFIEAWNTINIPLLARVSFGKKIVFFAEAGPFLSSILGGLSDIWDGIETPWYPLRDINIGVTIGTGIEVPLPHRFALSFEAYSNVGLRNMDSGRTYTSDDIKTYSCTLLCGFNYTLPLTKSKLKTPDR